MDVNDGTDLQGDEKQQCKTKTCIKGGVEKNRR